jgi:hypothetical protein
MVVSNGDNGITDSNGDRREHNCTISRPIMCTFQTFHTNHCQAILLNLTGSNGDKEKHLCNRGWVITSVIAWPWWLVSNGDNGITDSNGDRRKHYYTISRPIICAIDISNIPYKPVTTVRQY